MLPSLANDSYSNSTKPIFGEKDVLQDPNETVVEVGVHRLHVIQCDGFSQQLLVKRQREASVNVVAVKHCHAHDATHKVEIGQVLLQIEHDMKAYESFYWKGDLWRLARYVFQIPTFLRG